MKIHLRNIYLKYIQGQFKLHYIYPIIYLHKYIHLSLYKYIYFILLDSNMFVIKSIEIIINYNWILL